MRFAVSVGRCCLRPRAVQANRFVLLHGCQSGSCVLNSLFPAGAKPTAFGMILSWPTWPVFDLLLSSMPALSSRFIPATGLTLSETLFSLSGPACRQCRRLIPLLFLGRSWLLCLGSPCCFNHLLMFDASFLRLFRQSCEPDFGCRRQETELPAGLTAALP